ncbi:MAG TPA: 30S ribosome-binding factor RbfA [Pyrinomonadaceae bacterium]|nr:30S ribosome-binding factor RbfA [Pyrinomonadaceae bacterium]
MRRPERLAQTLREEIMEIVGYELEDPRVEAVTVTDVRVSDDLKDAKVYVLIEGNEKEIREAMKALQHAEKYVRSQVAMNLSIAHAPHIHFARDTVEEKAGRIDQILEELKDNGELVVEN